MTVYRPLAAIGLLLLSTAAVLADAAPADLASETACRLDRVREIIAGAEQSGTDAAQVDRLIFENTADWLPDYNAFAESPEAADLSAAMQAVGERPSPAQCRQFLPLAAIAASAARISAAGGEVSAGSILESCEGSASLCLPAAASRIIEQCGVALFTLPLRSTC